jgi:catechol 2,3-dioxygenase-like lactoylglutathione lyase family enzyme
MTLTWEQVVIDCQDFVAQGHWWADALGWRIIDESDDGIEIQNPNGSHPTILVLAVPEGKTVKNRLHLDFVPDDQDAEVERLLAMGAIRADVGQKDVPWVVLADPEGNEFCVLSAR